MENKQGLKLAKVLKNGNSSNVDETESEDDEAESKEEVVQEAAKQNGHVESNGVAKVDTASQKKEKPWTKEEIDMLRKGTIKFPKGTSQRWEVISEYIGTGRSVEEILKATKTVLTTEASSKSKENNNNNSKPVAAAGSDPNAWSDVQERALVQAMKTFPKETKQRWERVAAAVPGKTVSQCKKKFAVLKDAMRNKTLSVRNFVLTEKKELRLNFCYHSYTTFDVHP